MIPLPTIRAGVESLREAKQISGTHVRVLQAMLDHIEAIERAHCALLARVEAAELRGQQQGPFRPHVPWIDGAVPAVEQQKEPA